MKEKAVRGMRQTHPPRLLITGIPRFLTLNGIAVPDMKYWQRKA